ncbi:hypothetical protein GQ44DRAFT_726809 [Phaeosphaeriaceae sp. PMI808]|nr:hypothetical protein GQ44DRAFT_726809 [Phaeosphaeriaceae sp. PMI808]
MFTHGDLHQGNIMVKDGKITGLIDLELAGWYPEYWDYVKFCYSSGAHRDWMNYAKDIFSQSVSKTVDGELLRQVVELEESRAKRAAQEDAASKGKRKRKSALDGSAAEPSTRVTRIGNLSDD